MELGIDRVLTSGGRPTALEGVETLAELVRDSTRPDRRHGRRTTGRAEPASRHWAGESRVRSISARPSLKGPLEATTFTAFEGAETSWQRVDARRVARIVSAVRASEDADQSTSG